MKRFQERSTQKELIDAEGVPFADWETCLRELNTVNTFLGGHTITVSGIKKLLMHGNASSAEIAEIGCGGGDNLKAIDRWNNRKKYSLRFTGVDINAACVGFAQKYCASLSAGRFICSDYRHAEFGARRPDIIFNSLFCHHFSDSELVSMLQWMQANSRIGFFINDLQRHPLAYHSIGLLTKLFSRSYLVKNDGPVSVLRGFRKHEWRQLLAKAGITNYSIRWRWAFRYLVIVYNE